MNTIFHAALVGLLFVMFLGETHAQTTAVIGGCVKITWDANTEADLKEYRIYVDKYDFSGNLITAGTGIVVLETQTEKPCAEVGITENGIYQIRLEAWDDFGNGSTPTVVRELDWPDKTPPAMVTNTCYHVDIIVTDPATGKVISKTPTVLCD